MDSTKIAGAIVVAGVLIGCAVYFGLTQERREYMRTCEAASAYAVTNPDMAELLCATQYIHKR